MKLRRVEPQEVDAGGKGRGVPSDLVATGFSMATRKQGDLATGEVMDAQTDVGRFG